MRVACLSNAFSTPVHTDMHGHGHTHANVHRTVSWHHLAAVFTSARFPRGGSHSCRSRWFFSLNGDWLTFDRLFRRETKTTIYGADARAVRDLRRASVARPRHVNGFFVPADRCSLNYLHQIRIPRTRLWRRGNFDVSAVCGGRTVEIGASSLGSIRGFYWPSVNVFSIQSQRAKRANSSSH